MLCSHDSVPSGCSGTASSPFYDFCYDPNYDGSAYFVAGPTAMSFANARAYCSNLGMPLASIHSDSEQALANAACLDVTPDFCWLGGHSIGRAVPDFKSAEFKAQKEDFFGKKQAENAMRRDDLPPSQGGKYAGFGSSCNNPPARSYSTQDFVSNNWGGLPQSVPPFTRNP